MPPRRRRPPRSRSVVLMFKVQDVWTELLSIPLAKLETFCTRPLRWLLFVACLVWGTNIDGALSRDPDGPAEDIDTTDLPRAGAGPIVFFFRPATPKPLRFPDLEALERDSEGDVTETESDSVDSRDWEPTFRARIRARDVDCVLSPLPVEGDDKDEEDIGEDEDGYEDEDENEDEIDEDEDIGTAGKVCVEGIDACHGIPYAKGTRYLRALNAYRMVPEDEAVDHIEDPRNGLFLSRVMHIVWSHLRFGLLSLPNRWLSSEHIPPSSFSYVPTPAPGVKHLVFQQFGPLSRVALMQAQNNSIARYEQPDGMAPYLLDYLYICAVLTAYGVKQNFPPIAADFPPIPERRCSDRSSTDGPRADPASIRAKMQQRLLESKDTEEVEVVQPSTYELFYAWGVQRDPRLRAWRKDVAKALRS